MNKEVTIRKRKGIRIPESVKNFGRLGIFTYAYLLFAATIHEQLNLTSVSTEWLTNTSQAIDSSKAGHFFVGSVTNLINDWAAQTTTLDLSRAPLINLVDVLLVALPLSGGLISLAKNLSFNEDRLYGKEAVKGTPGHVIIAPSTQMLADIVKEATATGKLQNRKNDEVVGIHGDQGIPLDILPIQRQKGLIGHHFGFSDASELIREDEDRSIDPPLAIDSGLNTASEITFYCLSDIYSTGRDLAIGADKIYELLSLNNIKINGKTINVIVPDRFMVEDYPEHFIAIEQQLEEWQSSLKEKYNIDFKLNIFSPEKVFRELMTEKAKGFAVGRKPNEPIRFLHLNQTFSKFIYDEDEGKDRQAKIRYIYPNTISNLAFSLHGLYKVTNEGHYVNDPEEVEFTKRELHDMDQSTFENWAKHFREVDYIVFSAQSDSDALSMTEKLIKKFPILKGKMMVIIDQQKTADKLSESNLFVESFVPSKAVIDAFAKS